MIGDAPVPAQWVADRQSKIVQVQDSKELKPCECKTVPILSAVSKGLLKTHKVQSTGRHIHKQVNKFALTLIAPQLEFDPDPDFTQIKDASSPLFRPDPNITF